MGLCFAFHWILGQLYLEFYIDFRVVYSGYFYLSERASVLFLLNAVAMDFSNW